MTRKARADHILAVRPTSLALRLILVLTLAILPLGLISMYQTWRTLERAREQSETALLGRTQLAASAERELIQLTFGGAQAIGGSLAALIGGGTDCDAVFARLVASHSVYAFAGYVDADGVLACTSNGQHRDISDTRFYKELAASTERRVHTGPNVANESESALSVTVPVTDAGLEGGYIWIAMPFLLANEMLARDPESVDLVLFDKEGEILAAEAFSDDRRDVLPVNRRLSTLPRPRGYTFSGQNRRGEERDFAVVPIVTGTVYVLGSWDPDTSGYAPSSFWNLSLYVPALMWLASITVAYIGLDRLVIRHISRLRRWMRLYTAKRAGFENVKLDRAPEEIEAVAETFRDMIRRLTENERQREEDLREKTTLLREVHHRVKNNLQLISSIMNMQIRLASSPEARDIVRRLQERVLALAAIHRRLYMSRKLSMVRADLLLDDIVRNLINVGNVSADGRPVRISTDFAQVSVTPDQSMPLSLLVTEALTNALKHCAAVDTDDPWITINLHENEDTRTGCLSIVNSCAPLDKVPADADQADSAGLGLTLIDSFVMQLEGSIERNGSPNRYDMHLTFPLVDEATYSVNGDDDATDPAETA